MQNRLNVCPETAVTKASERLFPGISLSYNNEANNDEQCDLSTLFAKIPGKDLVIDNPGLGNKARALDQARVAAMHRLRREAGFQPLETLEERVTRLAGERDDFAELITRLEQPDILAERARFEQYQREALAETMAPMQDMLRQEFQKLTPPNTYILRTGTVGVGSGHFHALFYDAPNWILDSGFKSDGQPNKGVLYNTQTGTLGPMAESLLNPGVSWGRAQGQTMIGIYELNPSRTLIAAKYIEKFRQLSREETETVFPDALINEIIAQPDYLSTFGREGYWHAQRQGQHFALPNLQLSEYIRIALEQCKTQGLAGAVSQLQSKGYFNNQQQGRKLLSDMLATNKIDVVNAILVQNLVDLSQPNFSRALYQAALQFSQTNPDYPPGLNPSLRALQNKLLEILRPADLPFTIEQACESLNANAISALLDVAPVVNYEELRNNVMQGARACNSAPSTYKPLLEIINAHERALLTRPATVAPQATTPVRTAEPRLAEPRRTLHSQLRKINKIAANHDATRVWKKTCEILQKTPDYVCAQADRFKRGARPIAYQAETPDGRIIKKIVSEREQIILDKLYAQKLDSDYSPRLRR